MQFIHARIDLAFSDECIIITEDYGGLGAYVVMHVHNTSCMEYVVVCNW